MGSASQANEAAELGPASVLVRSPGAIAEHVLEETVVVDAELERYVRLNVTGRWVWERLAAPQALSELAAGLAAQFGISEAQALADVDAFACELLARGLVELAA